MFWFLTTWCLNKCVGTIQNIYYYPNSEGEVVLRVNTKYEYRDGTSSDHLPIWTKRNRVRRIMAQQFNIARIRYTWKNVWLKGAHQTQR